MRLPRTPDRALLRGFWFTLILSSGALVVVVGWVAGLEPLVLASVGIAAVFASLVGGESDVALESYRVWHRAARAYARRAERLTVLICHYLVFSAIAVANPHLKSRRLDDSGWTGAEPRAHGPEDQARPNWISQVSEVGRFRGEPWILSIVPFMALLRWFDGSQVAEPPPDVYTLY